MRKCYCIILFLLAFGFYAAAQTTLAQWDFNSSFSPVLANGTAPAQSSGVSAGSTIVLTGGVTADAAAGVAADPGTPNNGLNTTTYPAQSTFPKTAGIQITVNTAGYNSVKLLFYVRHSGSAAKKIIVQYFDGTTWQDVTSYTYLAPNNTNFSAQQIVDLSAFAPVNNSVSAKIRLVTDYTLPTMYEGATGAYGTSGTIRYDLVTITGNPNNCIGPATIQATGFRLLKSDFTSAQLTLNRGNGTGCLVVCSQLGIPTAPANGSNYVANSSFGAGNAIGNGFAVLNTWSTNLPIQYFNITNLAAGTKYYVAAYEYSNGSFCYLSPGYVDSFYCNSTVLYPGDLQFVGYDNNIASGGRDAFAITNLKSINTSTSFQIVNSRFEAGAPANTRTNRWYAGGDNIYANLQSINIQYIGASPLATGSVISFDFEAPSGLNVKVNNVPSTNFLITSKNVLTGVSILSTTGAEQFYLTQGKFTAYGTTATNDQYSLLDGHVLHGISYTNNWVGFGQGCSAGTNPGDRQSRVPPDIKCMNLFFNTSGNSHTYYLGPLHTGSQGLLLSEINNNSRWSNTLSTAGNDITPVNSLPFTITGNTPAGTWTGGDDYNWFNCENWEGRFVPDSTTDVVLNNVSRNPELDGSGGFEYNNRAMTRALSMPTGSIYMNGNTADRIFIYDSLSMGSTASIKTTNAGTDSVIVRGNIQCTNPANNLQLAGNVRLRLEGNRLLQPINVSLASATPLDVYSLTLNNGPGVRIFTGGFQSTQELNLADGIMTFANGGAFHHIGQGCNINSPINQFAETNRGWEKSFIDGKVFMHTNNASYYTAPIGNAAKNVFAPLAFEPDNGNTRTYEVSYTATSHPMVSPADIATPPLDRVSKQEYWSLTSADANAAAKIILYYTPYSHVGGGGNDGLALSDLRIAQYWDSMGIGGIKWRLYSLPGSYNAGLNINYGKISFDQFATDLRPQSQNFTLATISAYNTLPIHLVYWKAMLQGKQVALNWQVADETLVYFYTIEKSMDGVHFSSMQTIYNAGSSGNFNYTRYDATPAEGWNYYRLKATGIDGKTFYTAIEKVWNTSSAPFVVYPNPASDQLWLQLPAAGTVTLYTLEGKAVLRQNLPALSNQLNVKPFARGMYMLEYFDGRKRWSEKVQLQ